MTSALALSTVQLTGQRISQNWPWYIIRGSGFAGVGLLIIIMLSGIGMVTGLTYRFLEPVKAWAVHKALSIALLVVIALHIGFLLVDHFQRFSLLQLFVPFLNRYTNQTSLLGIPFGPLAIALGIFAMYGCVAIVVSSLGWIDSKRTAWRYIHYLSYLVMLAVFVHALYSGTDVRYGTFRAAFIGGFLLVLLGVISRLARSGTLSKDD